MIERLWKLIDNGARLKGLGIDKLRIESDGGARLIELGIDRIGIVNDGSAI